MLELKLNNKQVKVSMVAIERAYPLYLACGRHASEELDIDFQVYLSLFVVTPNETEDLIDLLTALNIYYRNAEHKGLVPYTLIGQKLEQRRMEITKMLCDFVVYDEMDKDFEKGVTQ